MNLRAVRRPSVLALVVSFVVAALGFTSADPVSAAEGTTSKYLAVGPVRLADTRGAGFGFSRVNGSTIRVAVANRGGVPASATAAVLTITATGSRGGGYISVYPAGTSRPDTSTLNLNAGGETVANTTLMTLAGGGVDIYASMGVNLLVDVAGAFVPAGSATAGRFVGMPSGAQRVLDTRGGRPVGVNGTVRVRRPDFVPADAIAIVANLTVVGSAGDGYWTAWPAGAPRPEASVLNTEAPGQTRAALTIVPISANGFDVYGSTGGHLLVDVAGYFTGGASASSGEGLFVPVTPVRAIDTRRNSAAVSARGEVEFESPYRGAALVYNLTSTGAAGAGFVTAHPAGTSLPNASNVNAPARGYTVANLAVTTQSTRGVGLYSASGEHLLADVTGYFTGTPVQATLPPPVPPPPPPPPPAPNGCTNGGVGRLNQVRSGAGVDAVADDGAAFEFACTWSKQMHDTKAFNHSPASQRDGAVGGCGSGENIAYSSGTGTDLFQLWIDSPPHYRNMIYTPYTHAGVAYYTGPNGTYGTMVLVIRC